MSLIEQRHPRLGELMRLWRTHHRGDVPPCANTLDGAALAELAPATVLVTLASDGADRLTIATSGSEVDALYGEALAGAPVERLAPGRSDAAAEAWSAIESGRPVTVEDDLRIDGRRRRIARMYLPLTKDDGSADGVLCGIVAVG
jgi:hypothetical protein